MEAIGGAGKGRRWCVTGGCGFIGTSLVRTLVRQGGHVIRVLDNLSVGTRADLAATARFAEADAASLVPMDRQSDPVVLAAVDIRDPDVLRRAMAGAEIVVHLAASTSVQASVLDPITDCEVNVRGTLNALDAAREGGAVRFVFASSGAPVAGNPPPVHEELAPRPVAPYGASKLAGEGYCAAFFRTHGLDTVTLRFGNVYGPGSTHKSSVVAKFIKAALEAKPLEIFGDGGQTRDFIYIDDLVEALTRAALVPGIGGEVFQIASGSETTINGLVATMLPLFERAGIRNVRTLSGALPKGDARRNYADTGKALRLLGWAPSFALEDGLARTIDWFLGRREEARLRL